MKRFLVLGIILVFIGTGCKNDSSENLENKLPFVELNMYLIGDKPADADLIYEELNKLIKAELNAELIVHFISWEEREQKYGQILSSGVAVDLIYTSDWCFYDTEARKGSFNEIKMEDVEAYMPLTYKNQPLESFEQSMIDQKMYMIPNYQKEFADYKLVIIRGDLREKYDLPPLDNFEALKNYYQVIQDNEPEMIPYNASIDNKELTYIGFWQENGLVRINMDNQASSFAIKYDDLKTDYQLYNILKMDAYLDYLYEMRAWYLRGYWKTNAIANKTSTQSAFEEGYGASLIWNIGTLNLSSIAVTEAHPEWKPEIYDITPSAPKILAKYTNNGIAIAKKSLHYERSMMLLDKLKNDERYWNLTWLGIEGVHWESVESNYYNVLQDAHRYPYAKTSCWGWGNEPFQRIAVVTPKASTQMIENWVQSEIIPITYYFRFNDEFVKEESTTCNEILSRYQPILELGMAEDVKATYDAMMFALDQGGWAAYEAEFERQYNEFLERAQ